MSLDKLWPFKTTGRNYSSIIFTINIQHFVGINENKELKDLYLSGDHILCDSHSKISNLYQAKLITNPRK